MFYGVHFGKPDIKEDKPDVKICIHEHLHMIRRSFCVDYYCNNCRIRVLRVNKEVNHVRN